MKGMNLYEYGFEMKFECMEKCTNENFDFENVTLSQERVLKVHNARKVKKVHMEYVLCGKM